MRKTWRVMAVLLAGVTVLGLLAWGMSSELQQVSAQTGPRITTVTLTSTSANRAQIDATFSEPVESRIVYGTTNGYGLAYPADDTFLGPAASRSFILTDLSPSTTYHYKIDIRLDADGKITSSADRTFPTRSSSGSGTQLVITGIGANCSNTQCDISFSTSIDANVQLRWDAATHEAFNDYNDGSVGEVADTFLATTRRLRASGLAGTTTYHYRLQGSDRNGNIVLTNDLTMRTSQFEGDYTFTTGACSDGTAIGQCSENTQGAYCDTGGFLRERCGDLCGFNCPSGQTCNTAQQCVIDPELSNSPFQCNNSSCYETSGVFKPLAPASCYSSWPKCAANTILKVRKDRGCNLWISCGTSVQLEAKQGAPAENLCMSLAACNSLNKQGQCNKYLPLGQCSNNPLRFCSKATDCEAGGSCLNPDPKNPSRALENLTFTSPQSVSQIADLSGNIVAGLDWAEQGGQNIIQGLFPWQLMRQIGGNAQIENADFESSAVDPKPWIAVPTTLPADLLSKIMVTFEDQDPTTGLLPPDGNNNRVLTVQAKASVQNNAGNGTCSNNSRIICDADPDCGDGEVCSLPNGECGKLGTPATLVSCNRVNSTATCDPSTPCIYPSIVVQFPGVASQAFTAVPDEFFYGEVRVRATKGTPLLRVQFGHSGYSKFTVADGADAGTLEDPAYIDIQATGAWQRVGLGPIKGLSGDTRLAVVCADEASCNESEFQIDDAQVKPVLQINNNPTYLSPSCRLYPKEDSPSCEYTENNVKYKGWRGYCLERDSVTGTCMSWWPVDVLKGESGVFGFDKTAGYADQSPLFYCAESEGKYTDADKYGQKFAAQYQARAPGDCCTDGANALDNNVGQPGVSFGANHSYEAFIAAAGADLQINVNQIYGIRFQRTDGAGGFGFAYPLIITQDSSYTNGCEGKYAGTQWSACWDNQLGNGPAGEDGQHQYGTVRFHFDELGFFTGVSIAGLDGGDGGGSFYIDTRWMLKEQCSKLVQVVTPSGETKPFVSRVASRAYEVPPPLGYTRTTDLIPYGAVLPPDGFGDQPDAWPIVGAEKPNSTTFGALGQSRSGTPYACVGDCSKMVCNIDPANNCAKSDGTPDPTKIRKCQSSTTVAGPNGVNNESDVNGDGLGDGQCVGVGTPGASLKGVQDFNPAIDPALIPAENPLCKVTLNKVCTAKASASGLFSKSASDATVKSTLLAKCKATVACDGTSKTCTNPNGTVVKYTDVGTVSCNAGLSFKRCSAQCTYPTGTTYNEAKGGSSNTYFTQHNLRRLYTQTFGVWELINGRYKKLDDSKGWLPPTEICPKGSDESPSRPAYPQDYCAVPPQVPDDPNIDTDGPQFLTGTAKQATISGGSGTIGIKFNTIADADQLPLKNVKIDWGDGTDRIDTFSYPFAPRSDASKPHVFSHVYVINPGTSNCNPKGVCTYPIRIQVEDNWGWCNDAKKVGDPDIADSISESDATADKPKCNTDSTKWQDTGLSVVVEP